MPSQTVEDYLKAIYRLRRYFHCARFDRRTCAGCRRLPRNRDEHAQDACGIRAGDVRALRGSATNRFRGALALRVLRRHRLIELFLVKTLGLAWDEVHEEAECMEHTVSDFLIDRVDAFLEHPKVDPHGDPSRAQTDRSKHCPGRRWPSARQVRRFAWFACLTNPRTFCDFSRNLGCRWGRRVRSTATGRESGVITVMIADRETLLGLQVAEKLLVSGL